MEGSEFKRGEKGMGYWLMMLKTIGMTLRHDI